MHQVVDFRGTDCSEKAMVLFLRAVMKDNLLIGCEIGVHEGYHAEQMLNILNIQKLYLIDPYEECCSAYKGYAGNMSRAVLRDIKRSAFNRLDVFRPQIEWLYMLSDEAVSKLPELDFVYIDGDHTYEQVSRDIVNYYKLVKNGGYLGGHDYCTNDRLQIDVERAVNEFVNHHNYKLTIGYSDFYPDFPDWWVRKYLP